MALQIVSKKAGFRRCGVAHSAEPVVHPDGTFTPDEVRRLRAEPMLVVVEVGEPHPAAAVAPKGGPTNDTGKGGEKKARAPQPAPPEMEAPSGPPADTRAEKAPAEPKAGEPKKGAKK